MNRLDLVVVVLFCLLLVCTTYPQRPHTVRMTVTAYCPCEICCGKWADGYTASGKPVTTNNGKFVAAPPQYEFHSRISVPGYHSAPVPVLDRGGAIKGNKLDVFFPTHKRALEWGVKELDCVVYP